MYRKEVEEVMKEFGQNFDVFALVEEIIKGKHPDQLLFTRSDGSPFTYDHYMKILRATTDMMNIPRGHFGGHSVNVRKSNRRITHFKLSNLTFVLKGFPDTTEFRKRLR